MRSQFLLLCAFIGASLACDGIDCDTDEDCVGGECVVRAVIGPSFRCEPLREYEDCRSDCIEICVDGRLDIRCSQFCEGGCFCRKGLVETSNGTCVKREDCVIFLRSTAFPTEEASGDEQDKPLMDYGDIVEIQDVYESNEIITKSKRSTKCSEVKTASGCRSGARCDQERGICVRRSDCPQPSIPMLKAGCVYDLVPDARDCPMPKITCSEDNLKCGDSKCEKGYECDQSTQKCVFRRDCPRIELPHEEGCTDTEELNEWDCLVPKRTCKEGNRIEKRASGEGEQATDEPETNRTKIACPKNAEYRECSDLCPPKSCQNFEFKSPCFSLRCGPAKCICKAGFVLLDGESHEVRFLRRLKVWQEGCVRRETCLQLRKATRTVRSVLFV